MDVSAFGVFLAGLVSFLSPCVLPLVPGYVSMLSGVGVEQLKEGQGSTGKLLVSAISFVIGFSAVFITFGASASAVGSFLVRNKNLLAPVAGALIVLFGLHLVGWLVKISVKVGLIVGLVLIAVGLGFNFVPGGAVKPVYFYATSLIFLIGPSLTRWLNRDVHLRNVGGNQPGVVSGFLLGFALAFGWTPCIGPILGGVLLVASTKATVGEGVFLLTCYSAGLAIPFLLTAVGIGRFLKFYQKFRRHLHTVEVFSGVLLLVIGGLVFANELTMVSSKLAFFQPENLIVIAKGKSPGKPAPASSKSGGSETLHALADEPDVTFKDLQGNNVTLASLKGKVVLVNFWGTWCEPCRGEIPILIGMQREFSSKGFTLLGVATDDEVSAVGPFVKETQFQVDGHPMTMNYPIVMGTDDISTQFGGLIGMPTSFLISRDGKIVKKYIGAFKDDEQIKKDVESQL